ncbi:MAG TPA: hypothetical protein VGJ73_21585 [Verrucomicrobiae bacterium]|jgi:hypothetical protein
MSTFSHILSMADSGSARTGGKEPNVSAAAAPGVAGLFADLMAQALSPVLPVSKESNPAPVQTNSEMNGKDQPLLAGPPVKPVNLHSGKIESQITPSPEIAGNSIVAAVATQKPAVQSSAVQSSSQTADKSDGTAKTEKNSQPPTAQPAVSPIPNELLINQILAGTVSAVSPIPAPPVKSPVNAISSPPERAVRVDKAVTGLVVAAQTTKSSGTIAKGSSSILPENETVTTGEPPAAPMAGKAIAESAGSVEKDEQNSVQPDVLANVSQAKQASNGPELPSVNDSSSNGQPAAQPSPDVNGISIAKQDLSVKQAEKTNNIAGQTEKVLPGNTTFMAQANSRLPVSPHSEQIAATAAASSDVVENSVAAEAPTVHSVSASSAPAVERMQEMVTLNAVRLSDSGNNLMQVVIKPDSGTQLSLELRQHGGSVEVQAVLQQGDFHQLNQQWPELQQRLGQRGIQLAPLAGDATAAHGGATGSFQQQHQSQTAAPVAEDYFSSTSTRQILPAIVHAPVIAPSREQRGWETWA